MRSSKRIPQIMRTQNTSQRVSRNGVWGSKDIPLIRKSRDPAIRRKPDPMQGIYNGTFRRISGRSYSATNHKEMDWVSRGERITQDSESSAEAVISTTEPFSIHCRLTSLFTPDFGIRKLPRRMDSVPRCSSTPPP